jgi:3-hydroxyisobutyrate dehydrogenase
VTTDIFVPAASAARRATAAGRRNTPWVDGPAAPGSATAVSDCAGVTGPGRGAKGSGSIGVVSPAVAVRRAAAGFGQLGGQPLDLALVVVAHHLHPEAAREMAARLAGQGVAMLDAPVSGGSEGARAGTLTIMVGGKPADFEQAQPVLQAMGRTITRMGPIGSGQATKAVNQVILCGTYLGVAEGIVLALKAGLDPEAVVNALTGGAANSWVLQNRSASMIDDRYPLGFKLALHRKDMAIALELARSVGASLPVAALTVALEDGLLGQGHGDDDISALARAIRQLAGL